MIKKIFFLLSSVLFFVSCHGDDIYEANTLYTKGLQASTMIERKNAFNHALSLYKEFESAGARSEKLYEALGDIYYHLEEYPWAILYYYRALELTPINTSVEKHLKLAQEKLGLSPKVEQSIMHRIVSVGGFLPLSYRFFLFFLVTCAAVACLSFVIWLRTPFWSRLAVIFLAIEGILFLNILLSLYFTPVEGVLIKPTALYRGAAWDQPQAMYVPLVKGVKVRVLEEEQEGKWLKIVSTDGTIGYIPWDVIRII